LADELPVKARSEQSLSVSSILVGTRYHSSVIRRNNFKPRMSTINDRPCPYPKKVECSMCFMSYVLSLRIGMMRNWFHLKRL